MRKLLALSCAVALLFVAGCGSSGGDDADKGSTTTTTAGGGSTTAPSAEVAAITAEDYAAAFATGLTKGDPAADLVLKADEADCVAPKWVDAIGVDTLHTQGVTVEQASSTTFDTTGFGLGDAEGQQMLDAFDACDVDIYTLMTDSLTAGLTADQQSCVAKEIDHDLADAVLVKALSSQNSDTEFQALIDQLTKACDLPAN